MEEIWKDVVGYEGYYKVSNLGNVKSLTRTIYQSNYSRIIKGKLVKPFINGSGYLQCKLHKNGEVYHAYVHKLVAEAFIDNPNDYNEVNHIDHNKLNNEISNLEWCTRRYNMNAMIEFYGKEQKQNYCKCGVELSYYAENCINCLGLKNRKVKERPNKDDLLELIINIPFTKIGEMYGVSDNAIRKWCKDYNIPHRKKDLIKLKSIG